MVTEDERRIAHEILKKVKKLNLPLKLDKITEGKGNCFPLAIISQCKRSEIFRQLSEPTQNLILCNDPTKLRKAVSSFILNSENPKIQTYRKRYQEIVAPVDKKSWEEYWNVMIRNYEWVDYIFIQSTAWFLGHDIIIVTTTSTENNPFLTISGNIIDEAIPCPGTEIIIGSKSQVHFQSLLPIYFRVGTCEINPGLAEDTINLKIAEISETKSKCYSEPKLESNAGFPGLYTAKRKKFQNSQLNDKSCKVDINSKEDFPELEQTNMNRNQHLKPQSKNRE